MGQRAFHNHSLLVGYIDNSRFTNHRWGLELPYKKEVRLHSDKKKSHSPSTPRVCPVPDSNEVLGICCQRRSFDKVTPRVTVPLPGLPKFLRVRTNYLGLGSRAREARLGKGQEQGRGGCGECGEYLCCFRQIWNSYPFPPPKT